MDNVYDVVGMILGAWVVTRIVYMIVNFRLNRIQEAVLGFVVGLVFIWVLGMLEYIWGFIIWLLLDITGITNNFNRKKKAANKNESA